VTLNIECEICQKEVKVIKVRKHIYCSKCLKQNSLKKKIHVLEKEAPQLINLGRYERDLYKLYLDYIKRYCLKHPILQQARDLLSYLSSNEIVPFTSWDQVYLESKQFSENYKVIMGLTGNPFIKIGKMLVELGVLPPKCENYSQNYLKLISRFPDDITDIIKNFIEFRKNRNIADKSIITSLERILFFSTWVNIDILLVNQNDIQNYIIHLQNRGNRQHNITPVYLSLSVFYKWCKHAKIILANPFEGIKISRPRKEVIVCDDHIVSQIMEFIKNPKSNPEQAFLLALILIWGLKSNDLSHAKIDITNGVFKIIFRRKKISTIKYYNRKQILELPKCPEWFFSLQKKFYTKWLHQYGQLKKSCPNYYLMLPRYRSVQTLTKDTIKTRVFEATMAAVGKKIPLSVLRKTCGHLHSTSSDSSILSTIGWSRDYCFKYTWMPRVYFQKKF